MKKVFRGNKKCAKVYQSFLKHLQIHVPYLTSKKDSIKTSFWNFRLKTESKSRANLMALYPAQKLT